MQIRWSKQMSTARCCIQVFVCHMCCIHVLTCHMCCMHVSMCCIHICMCSMHMLLCGAAVYVDAMVKADVNGEVLHKFLHLSRVLYTRIDMSHVLHAYLPASHVLHTDVDTSLHVCDTCDISSYQMLIHHYMYATHMTCQIVYATRHMCTPWFVGVHLLTCLYRHISTRVFTNQGVQHI